MTKTSRLLFTLFALCAVFHVVHAQPSLLACPGGTYRVKQFETFPLPTGDDKNSYRLCFKLVSAMDNSPSSAEVWSINDGGAGSAEQGKGSAFFHTGRSYHKSEFKLGAVPVATLVYWNWMNLYSTSISEQKQLDRMVVLPATPGVEDGVVLNPCIPICKQTKRPQRTADMKEKACYYTCGSGSWQIECPTQPIRQRDGTFKPPL